MSYLHDSLEALNELLEGQRSLVIVSRGKSELAFDTAEAWAKDNGYVHDVISLVCEDGEEYPHVFVAKSHLMVGLAQHLIFGAKSDQIPREVLQRRLGMLLGYHHNSIDEFVESEVGQTCPCDCCGGPPRSVLPRTDHDEAIRQARRTQFYNN